MHSEKIYNPLDLTNLFFFLSIWKEIKKFLFLEEKHKLFEPSPLWTVVQNYPFSSLYKYVMYPGNQTRFF